MSDKIIHWRIAKVAKEIAATCYEELAKENDFHRLNRTMERYVRRNWQHYIPFARKALVDILTKDFSMDIALGSYTAQAVEEMKAEVYECLVIDGMYKGAAPPTSSLVH